MGANDPFEQAGLGTSSISPTSLFCLIFICPSVVGPNADGSDSAGVRCVNKKKEKKRTDDRHDRRVILSKVRTTVDLH